MKLQNILENEDQAGNNMDKMKYASEKFIQTLQKYKKEHLFFKKINVPEGEIHSTLYIEDIPFTPERFNEGYLGDITIKIDYMPNMDPKPIIPLNILQVAVSNFMDSLLKINPDLMNKPSIFPPSLLDMYHFKISNVSVFPSQGVLSLRDYMETPTFNLKVLSPHDFGGLLLSRSYLLNAYKLNQGDLPTFSDDYSLAMSKLLKKAKTVFMGLRKGTWKGRTYEIEIPHNWRTSFYVHQDKYNFNKEDKVLHPNFDVGANFGWELIDGIKNSPEESPLTPDERTEFKKWLTGRFKQFGIHY